MPENHQPVAILPEESPGPNSETAAPNARDDHKLERCDRCGDWVPLDEGWFFCDSFICKQHLWMEYKEG